MFQRASRIAPDVEAFERTRLHDGMSLPERPVSQTTDRAAGEMVHRLCSLVRPIRRGARVAMDATGLTKGGMINFFLENIHHHAQILLPWRH